MQLQDFSSKIKKIYLELHNYSFFHGPSDITNIDKRFIGRHKAINRLRTILSNSSTKSGAYLITGYRGIGKSSFVSKVINELSSAEKPLNSVIRFIRLSLVLYIMAMLNFNHGLVSIGIFGLFFLLSSFYLVFSSNKYNDLNKKQFNKYKCSSVAG